MRRNLNRIIMVESIRNCDLTGCADHWRTMSLALQFKLLLTSDAQLVMTM